MSELRELIEAYFADLKLQNASPHTLRNYREDLEQFLEYFSPPGTEPPHPRDIDALAIREWLGSLYDRRLNVISIRRKLAAVRSLFKFMVWTGRIPIHTARLVRTPKAPKTVPA